MAVVADTSALQDRLADENELILVPSIVVAEYLAGSRDAMRDLADLAAAADLQPFTVGDAAEASALARRAIKKGSFPWWMDVLITGFASNRGDLAVVTRNPKHFPKSVAY